MSFLTIDLDNLEEIDALYLIDKLSEALRDPDPVTRALAEVASDIADGMEPRCSFRRQYELADEIYPQTDAIWTHEEYHRHNAKRDEHLRRFGFLKEVGE